MPRNAQGVYSLPAGNPVEAGTLVESVWANDTMSDIGNEITASLPRDGSAPMTGALTLPSSAPLDPRHATNKAYVDRFIAAATGLPVGGIVAVANAATSIPGFLFCNGQTVSRTEYSILFAAIGTVFGSGDGVNTFNVPDLRQRFIKGASSALPLGTFTAESIKAHLHPISDAGHSHSASQVAHTHTANHAHTATQAAHSHTINHGHSLSDPGHVHGTEWTALGGVSLGGSGGTTIARSTGATGFTYSGTTGISINPYSGSSGSSTPAITVASTSVTTSSVAALVTVGSSQTGIVIGSSGGAETQPNNVALFFWIKAIPDAEGVSVITGILSSDEQAIFIDNTNLPVVELDVRTNVPFGLAKLDSVGKLPLNIMSSDVVQVLGTWDASTGNNPSDIFPAMDWPNAVVYVISVAGTISVIPPGGSGYVPTSVLVNGYLLYIEDSLTEPTGWHYIPPDPGTVVHNSTLNREVADCHPIEAITGLDTALGDKLEASQFPNITDPVTLTSDDLNDLPGRVGNLETGKLDASLFPNVTAPVAATDALLQAAADDVWLKPRRNFLDNSRFIHTRRNSAAVSWTNPASEDHIMERWRTNHSGTGSSRLLQVIAFVPSDPMSYGMPGEHVNFFRYTTTVVGTATFQRIEQRIEVVETLAGRTVTMSFWARSRRVGGDSWKIHVGNNYGSGGSAAEWASHSGRIEIPGDNVWRYYQVPVIVVPGLLGKTIGLNSYNSVLIEFGANTTVDSDFAYPRLEIGERATSDDDYNFLDDFERCNRYFNTYGASAFVFVGRATGSTSVIMGSLVLTNVMRASPVFETTPTFTRSGFTGGTIGWSNTNKSLRPTVTSPSSATTGQAVILDVSSQVGLDADL